MSFVFSMLLILSAGAASAHEHGGGMKARPAPGGRSVLQLGSEWKNQRGESTSLAGLRGKPRLMVMLYTRCETACPLLVEDLKEIAREAEAGRGADKLEVSLFSLDSFRETPESLAAFAAKRKLPPHWGLFTSDANAVAELAAALGVRYKRLPGGDFIHSNVIYFLNPEGEVVAQKEGLKTPRAELVGKIREGL